MTQPLVGITGRRRDASVLAAPAGFADAPLDIFFADYATSIARAGGTPVFLPLDGDPADLVGRLDAVLLAGGEDVDPANYGASPAPQLGAIDPARDAFELALTRGALEHDVPLLGICRGQQLLNVALGGTILQHVDGHLQREHRGERTHDVSVVAGTRHAGMYGDRTRVNSFHHQTVERLGDGAVAAAHDADGHVEAIDVPGARALAVQWHPETFGGDPAFDWLVQEGKK
ncbi:MAG TPA: gamma-glutamyl-gamma-aminobutyrate hydrolase family protein [Pseudolysinimonas sp.]|nr:gamma-glutamyl-gamma-aminobutyrate hydrolase family protein [Pseudolysinimonas sp.]